MKFRLIDESKKKKNKKHELGYFTSFLPDKEKGIDKFNNSVDFGKVDGNIDGGVTADGGNAVFGGAMGESVEDENTIVNATYDPKTKSYIIPKEEFDDWDWEDDEKNDSIKESVYTDGDTIHAVYNERTGRYTIPKDEWEDWD